MPLITRPAPLGFLALFLLGGCASAPLGPVLGSFESPSVPVRGPEEDAPQARSWTAPASLPEGPGHGLAEHPMLYAGEGYNTLFLVNHGRVVWSYAVPGKGEIDDVWLLTNGHILLADQFRVLEMTSDKQIVWRYDPPAGTEVHSCQPIGLDRVLMVQNGLPPKAIVIEKKTNAIVTEHALPAESLTDQKTVHPQFRRIRMTAEGTYLLPFLKMAKVAEFDSQFHEVWSYSIPTPWAAIRLASGNTLIVDEHDKLVREVDHAGATVWEFSQKDLPAGIEFHNLQTCDRLANGNTVIFSSTGGSKKEERASIIQAVEVTKEKQVVWVLKDWRDLGPATTAQFLDQPGIPESPGALAH